MTFESGTERECRVQRVSKLDADQHLCIDLTIAEAALAGLLDDTVEVELPEGPLVVVSLAGLMKMKRLIGRPQDLADLERFEPPDAD